MTGRGSTNLLVFSLFLLLSVAVHCKTLKRDGKRPTDALFMNGGCESLYEYVEAALSEQVMKIVDPLLLACHESNLGIRQNEELENDDNLVEIEESKVHNFFHSIFKIGLTCASRSPMDRMHMNEVSRELQKIKKTFFA